MKRLSFRCGLFHPAVLFIVASLATQHPALGQKGLNRPSGSSGMGMGMGGSSGMGGGSAQSSEEKAAAAFRDRCLLLTTKFQHNGVEFQSKTGIGCVIAAPQGQRILAMPLSLTLPIEISQAKANAKLTIPSSLLLAAKIGSDKKSRERLEAFAAQVADMPIPTETKDLVLESDRKIYRALSERTEISFNHTPLSGVMKFFREAFNVSILIDELALATENISPDEPIILELPEVTFRSSLNLILDPLELTYVIENEVLKITSKRAAARAPKEGANFESTGQRGIAAYRVLVGGMGPGGMGGGEGGQNWFERAVVKRYRTFQEAQRATIAPTGGLNGGGYGGGYGGMGMGGGSYEGGMSMGGGGMDAMGGQRRDYAAIHGPLAVHMNEELGLAFINLPGDFQAISIPTSVDPSKEQLVMVDDSWESTTDTDASRRAAFLDGSPVVSDRGQPVGMLIGGKVISFAQVFESLLTVDTNSLGYWGADSAKIEAQIVDGLPELIPAELKSQIKKASSLSGKERDKAMLQLRSLLAKRVADRNRFAGQKIDALHSKLSTLTRLASEMKNKDAAEANKFLPKELALEILAEDDLFK